MPGHVKLGKAGEPDPDPCPYLVVTLEMKREDALKPYDPKKSYWCPDGKGNYMECILENDDGTKAVVMCGHEVKLIAHGPKKLCPTKLKKISKFEVKATWRGNSTFCAPVFHILLEIKFWLKCHF